VAALALGIVVILAGIVMDGYRGWLIRQWTSRSLGTLAPGYAAGDRGFRVYTALVRTIGIVLVSLWVMTLSLGFGAVLLLVGAGGFLVFSVIAIVGEVRTYRAVKR
jgi:hypothetical protein